MICSISQPPIAFLIGVFICAALTACNTFASEPSSEKKLADRISDDTLRNAVFIRESPNGEAIAIIEVGTKVRKIDTEGSSIEIIGGWIFEGHLSCDHDGYCVVQK